MHNKIHTKMASRNFMLGYFWGAEENAGERFDILEGGGGDRGGGGRGVGEKRAIKTDN